MSKRSWNWSELHSYKDRGLTEIWLVIPKDRDKNNAISAYFLTSSIATTLLPSTAKSSVVPPVQQPMSRISC